VPQNGHAQLGRLELGHLVWNCERPFRPVIRDDAYCSSDLLYEAPHQAKAVTFAQGRLHKADPIIADRESGIRGTRRQNYVNRTGTSRERMKVCVRYDLLDDAK
jgi:hypothetical protein